MLFNGIRSTKKFDLVLFIVLFLIPNNSYAIDYTKLFDGWLLYNVKSYSRVMAENYSKICKNIKKDDYRTVINILKNIEYERKNKYKLFVSIERFDNVFSSAIINKYFVEKEILDLKGTAFSAFFGKLHDGVIADSIKGAAELKQEYEKNNKLSWSSYFEAGAFRILLSQFQKKYEKMIVEIEKKQHDKIEYYLNYKAALDFVELSAKVLMK